MRQVTGGHGAELAEQVQVHRPASFTKKPRQAVDIEISVVILLIWIVVKWHEQENLDGNIQPRSTGRYKQPTPRRRKPMKSLRLLAAATIVLCLVGLPRTHAAQKSEQQLQTGVLGGIAGPSAEELAAMQKGQYIFHARDSVVLDDGLILTIAGTCDVYNGDGYAALVGVSNLMAIRWKPVND